MDGIGKVDAGGTRGQVDDIALGGKGKDLLGQQVALQVMEQVAGVLADALVFQQLADPGQALVQLIVTIQPSLYFQWAATPYSACSSILRVRICTSKGMPSWPMTVVCKLW